MKTEFDKWWNEDDLTTEGNNFVDGTPAWWAWEGWCAAVKAERNSWPAEMEAMERQVNILTDALAAQPAPVQEPVASYKGPEELWLQLHGDCSDDELTEPVDYTDDSVTWCWHQIYDSDVRYVREDTAAQRQWVEVEQIKWDGDKLIAKLKENT